MHERGQEEQGSAQLIALRQQEASLRVTIDGQIRSSMLDVQAAAELVKVAQANAKANGVSVRIHFAEGDLLAPITKAAGIRSPRVLYLSQWL